MLDLVNLIKTIGHLGIFGIIFAESGLLIGFFLPGDSLLFTSGFLASQNFLNFHLLLVLNFVAAILGDNVGYAFGKKVGPKLFKREDSLLFHKEHLDRAKRFYERYGGKTIILARFMPVIRTFAPILAGVGEMRYKSFLFYNFLGALIWAVGLTSLGYFLGSAIPSIDRYLLPIIIFIILVSVLPSIIHILRNQSDRAKIISFIKSKLNFKKS